MKSLWRKVKAFLPRLVGPARGIFLAACVLFLLLVIAALFFEPSKLDSTGPVTITDSTNIVETDKSGKDTVREGAVRVQAWLESNELRASSVLHSHVVVENHWETDILVNSFQLLGNPGLQDAAITPKLPATIHKGKALEIVGTQIAKDFMGRYSVAGLLDFSLQGQNYRKTLNFGSIEITSRTRELLAPLARLQGFILPVVLALLGVIFQRAAEGRAQRSEIWNNLLPQFMQRAELYYMPLNRAAKDLVKLMTDWHDGKEADTRRVFYQLMLFLFRMKNLRDKIGGITFKNRHGEEVAAKCLLGVRELVDNSGLNLVSRDLILDKMRPNESYAKFSARYRDTRLRDSLIGLEDKAVRGSKASITMKLPQRYEP